MAFLYCPFYLFINVFLFSFSNSKAAKESADSINNRKNARKGNSANRYKNLFTRNAVRDRTIIRNVLI